MNKYIGDADVNGMSGSDNQVYRPGFVKRTALAIGMTVALMTAGCPGPISDGHLMDGYIVDKPTEVAEHIKYDIPNKIAEGISTR